MRGRSRFGPRADGPQASRREDRWKGTTLLIYTRSWLAPKCVSKGPWIYIYIYKEMENYRKEDQLFAVNKFDAA